MDIAANLDFIAEAVARTSRPAIVTAFGGSLNPNPTTTQRSN
jgi:hypothetical protein